MTINVICFSKNRACQLDLTLSTFKKYFKEWKDQTVNIIYTYTDDFYKQGYDKVKEFHPEFNWIKERDFKNDTLVTIASFLPYTAFLVDDDVFIDNFSINDPEIQEFFNNEDISCVSPRMAPYINFCYTQNKPQPPPIFNEKRMWKWKEAVHDWNYPTSIASFHIFRTKDLVFLNTMPFKGPNSLEGNMCGMYPQNRNYMICYNHAKCFCAATNKIQCENNNRHENSNSLEDLNTGFINGERLSPDINDKYTFNMAHGPIKYEWR